MIRSQHLDVALRQSRHRILCGILTAVEPGKDLVERARILGIPVDWDDPRQYPNRPGYSDFGATYLLAKDVFRAEAARSLRMTGQAIDTFALDSHAGRLAKEEATRIFNDLIGQNIQLSGCEGGRFYTCKTPLPWAKPAHSLH